MTKNETIAIALVGGGAAGTATAHYLVQFLEKQACNSAVVEIDIYEKRGLIGPGLAFERDNDALLMNMVTKDASLFADNLKHFWEWLALTKQEQYKNMVMGGSSMAPDGFLPRGLFGHYMGHTFHDAALKAKRNGMKLRERYCEVIAIDQKSNGFELRTSTSEQYQYDFIVLCTGNSEPKDFYKLQGYARYINNPYPVRNYLTKIAQNDRIGIIGSQLTAADIAITMSHAGHKGPINLLSRTHDLPAIRSILRPHTLRFMTLEALEDICRKKNFLSQRDLLRALRQELGAVGENWRTVFFEEKSTNPQDYFQNGIKNSVKEQPWQSVLVAIDQVIEHYWNKLSEQSKNEFLNLYHRKWNSKRVPLPITTAYKINALLMDGQLRYSPGLKKIYPKSSRVFYAHVIDNECIASTGEVMYEFDWIINATGPDRHIDLTQTNLIRYLIESGMVACSPYGGIKVDFETSALIKPSGKKNEQFYALGHPTNGTFYFVSSLEMISNRARKVATELVNQISKLSVHNAKFISTDISHLGLNFTKKMGANTYE